ncbi:hypothetical protein HUT16_24155 [Kitasatospora sp. NA04385]|uniref:transcriptional repressor NsdA n=1 Tax=Kitasatospora sp. NA04385 TaxID=2742135 RepID=UPI001592516D|nr:hypothetical protein [Kitasatospora sp. NA04385]QKW21738.1 hypothetical protein HUT16_24155 [Kitasatospora sp. NA04385]
MGEKQPNEKLGSWFARSGWSKGELARQVNRRARQIGAHHVSTDTSRVRRWLDGEQPREPIPKIMSELFSERFGSVVSVEDLGLRAVVQVTTAGSGVDLPWSPQQTVQAISEYSRSDLMLNRRGFLGTSLALTAGAALIEPMQRWLTPGPNGAPTPILAAANGGEHFTGRLSEPEMQLLEQTTEMFRKWDAQNGGGLRRKAVVGQLHEVTDLLQESYPEAITKRLFRITAELAHLAGFMSYDVGMHPSAQKYYVLALHAAKEAGDRPFGAHVLTDMSRQMIHLNRGEDALELIHLAQYGSRDTATARQQSLLYAMEARAYSNIGELNRCARAVRLSEDTFSDIRESNEETPNWLKFFSYAELCAENGHSYRDLAYTSDHGAAMAKPAERLITEAVDRFRDDQDHVRTYAFNLVGMASVRLLQNEPEEAAKFCEEAVDIAKKVRSERLNTRVRKTSEAASRDFRGAPGVARLAERVVHDIPEFVSVV